MNKSDKKQERRVFNIEEKILGHNNPNHDIFIVESEEGADSDDNMCSMIGDATMAHLQRLSVAERQCWEHFVMMPSKNLFDFAPSTADNDRDPHGLKVEDLDEYFLNYKIDEKLRPILEEAIQNEAERREKSEDVYDRSELLIPYQDWADNPGLSKHFDIPTTPKDNAIYCGNTTQSFYDYFPEGHPDSKIINDLLVKVNRDSLELTDRYGEWLKTWLGQQPIKLKYTHFILDLLITRLVEGEKDPEEMVKAALTCLDDDYRKHYIKEARVKLDGDGIRNLLLRKRDEWDEEHRKGMNVLPFVKTFGQLLYGKFRRSVKKSHWALYKSLKARYAGSVFICGVDINNCRLGELERALKVSRRMAMEIWTNRPYGSAQELLKREVHERAVVFKDPTSGQEIIVQHARNVIRGWLTKDMIQEQRGNIEELYELVRSKAEEAHQKRNLKILSNLSQVFVSRQKEGKDNWSSKEWSALWTYYRSTKSDILSKVKESHE